MFTYYQHCIVHSYIVNAPTLGNLTLISWTSSEGKRLKIQTLRRICDKYHTVGLLLGLSLAEIDNYMKMSWNDSVKCCSRIFFKWIENNGHCNYPRSWQGLCHLLDDIEKKRVKEDLKKALAEHGVVLSV